MKSIIRFIANHPHISIFVAIVSVGITVASFMIMFNRDNEGAVQNTPTKFALPDVASIIPVLFNSQNTAAVYDWALVAEDEEQLDTPMLLEMVTFESNGDSYELILATKRGATDDEETFTETDYISLTREVSELGQKVIFIDLYADGILDSVHVDDTLYTDRATLTLAQEQYSIQLYNARDFMLGKTSI